MALLVYGLAVHFVGRLWLLVSAFREGPIWGLAGLLTVLFPLLLLIDMTGEGSHLRVLVWLCIASWPASYVYGFFLRGAGVFPKVLLFLGDALFAWQGGLPALKAAVAGDVAGVRAAMHHKGIAERADDSIPVGQKAPVACDLDFDLRGDRLQIRGAVRNDRTFALRDVHVLVTAPDMWPPTVTDVGVGSLPVGAQQSVSQVVTMRMRVSKSQLESTCTGIRAE